MQTTSEADKKTQAARIAELEAALSTAQKDAAKQQLAFNALQSVAASEKETQAAKIAELEEALTAAKAEAAQQQEAFTALQTTAASEKESQTAAIVQLEGTLAEAGRTAEKQAEENETLKQDLFLANAALVVNGQPVSWQAFSQTMEAFGSVQEAVQAALAGEVIRQEAARQGLEGTPEKIEAALWEAELEDVQLSEAEVAKALKETQQKEEELAREQPEQYAAMLEQGQAAAETVPAGWRFIQDILVPADADAMEEARQALAEVQRLRAAVEQELTGPGSSKLDLSTRTIRTMEREEYRLRSEALAAKWQQLKDQDKEAAKQAQALYQAILSGQMTAEEAAGQYPNPAQPTLGFAVTEGVEHPSAGWAAAMALKAPGDISAPVKLSDGYHIFYYREEITGDSPSVAQAREALLARMLEEAKAQAKETMLQQWISKADVTVNPALQMEK